MKRTVASRAAFFFVAAMLGPVVAAQAASPLAVIQVGSTAKYKITTQTTGAKKKPQSTMHNAVFTRTSNGTIQVRLDGKKAGTLSVGSDGSVTIPVNLQAALGAFNAIDTLMHAAPAPLVAGDTWSAVAPVPVADQTDNVSVTLKVTQLTEGTVTVTGAGNNTMDVTMGNKTRTANVTVSATMSYGLKHELTSASGSATAIVSGAKKRGGQFGTSWTVTQF